jgi:hypothetical protein
LMDSKQKKNVDLQRAAGYFIVGVLEHTNTIRSISNLGS